MNRKRLGQVLISGVFTVCGLVIAVEFALDGKITVGGQGLSPWLLYALMAAGLCALAAAEHRAHSEDNRTARDR